MTRLTSLIGILTIASVSAFSQHFTPKRQPAKLQDAGDANLVAKAFATAAMTAFLWVAPVPLTHQLPGSPYIANAVEKASGTGSRVNKDADSLLRLGLPIKNKEVRGLQESLETIKYDVGSKRKAAALDGVKKSKSYLTGKTADKMKASCRSPSVCASLLTEIESSLDPLQASIKQSQDAFTGSEQERTALDKAYGAQQKATDFLTDLEEQMIPENYETPVPSDYLDLPRLKKRATVEMVVKKAEAGAQFDVNGVNFPEARMTMVIDGYAAPITGGNFVDLVNKGFYTNMAIQRSDGFVVQTGDPDGKAVGYVGTPSKAIGAGPNGERLIPTEIFVRGDKGPFYESTIEDEGRGGEATILPFSAYGAMGWAREEYDVNSGSSQFFWLLFDSDLTPAGKNVLDGRYPCFGYVVEGSDFLSDIKEGDVIVSAKVTKGLENLVDPKA
mmetsp:Transcript_10499/g.25357  ORF Transcript_10499/g.25357 Transcript_10499/m.25357 type:complete len:444 (-) Transcript_10499:1637-2968(-)